MRLFFIYLGVALVLLIGFIFSLPYLFEENVYQNERAKVDVRDLRFEYPVIKSDTILEEREAIIQHFLKPTMVHFKSDVVKRDDSRVFFYFSKSNNSENRALALAFYYNSRGNNDSVSYYSALYSDGLSQYFKALWIWEQSTLKSEKRACAHQVLDQLEASCFDQRIKLFAFDLFKEVAISSKAVYRLKPFYNQLDYYYQYRISNSLWKYFLFLKSNVSILLFSVLSVVLWFVFIIQFNFFNKRIDIYILSFILGVFSILILFPVFSEVFYPLSNVLSHSLISFCIVGIGFTEEVTKITPVVILMIVFRKRLQVIDYLIIGGCSGLAFAFIENTGKLYTYSLSSFDSRTVLCSISHACNTIFFTYQLTIAFYKNTGWVKRVLMGLLISAFLHGMWDYLIFSDIAMSLTILYYAIIVLYIMVLVRLMNNGLNVSKYYTYMKYEKRFLLPISFTFVLLLTFIIETTYVGVIYGSNKALEHLITDSISYVLMFSILVFQLLKIRFLKGYWEPITLRSFFRDYSIDNIINQTFEVYTKTNLLGKKVIIDQSVNDNNEIVFTFDKPLKLDEELISNIIIPDFVNQKNDFNTFVKVVGISEVGKTFKLKIKNGREE